MGNKNKKIQDLSYNERLDRIQDLLKENRRLQQLSEKDFLTGLFNRRKLEEDLQRYIELNERHKTKFFVMMIDINKFKEINDTRGHKIGDKVLREVARRLQYNIRKSDKAYRLAGDEFIIIFSHYKSKKELITRIRKSLENINIYVSIGICDLKDKYCKDILEIIDKRMYIDKRGKKC